MYHIKWLRDPLIRSEGMGASCFHRAALRAGSVEWDPWVWGWLGS